MNKEKICNALHKVHWLMYFLFPLFVYVFGNVHHVYNMNSYYDSGLYRSIGTLNPVLTQVFAISNTVRNQWLIALCYWVVPCSLYYIFAFPILFLCDMCIKNVFREKSPILREILCLIPFVIIGLRLMGEGYDVSTFRIETWQFELFGGGQIPFYTWITSHLPDGFAGVPFHCYQVQYVITINAFMCLYYGIKLIINIFRGKVND